MDQSYKFSLSPTESLSRAWDAVTSNLGVMAGFTLLYYAVISIIQRIPFVGGFSGLFQFVLGVSLFSAFEAIDRHGKAQFNDLFNWTSKFGSLFGAHLLSLLAVVVLLIPAFIIFFVSMGVGAFSSLTPEGFGEWAADNGSAMVILGIVGASLIALLVFLVLFFAVLFVVQFRDVSLGQAFKISFKVGTANMGSILLFMLLSVFVIIAGVLALLIGILVAIPILFGMQYYMLRSIFPTSHNNQWDFMAGRNEIV